MQGLEEVTQDIKKKHQKIQVTKTSTQTIKKLPASEVEEESEAEEATLSEEEELAFEADQINNLAEELHGLEIMVKNFGIDFVMPFIMYDYINADRRYVTCDYLVLTLNKENFSPRVSTDGKELLVGTNVPSFFQDKARIMIANQSKNARFTSNTHKATAFGEVVRRMNDSLNWPDVLNGAVQRTALPFPCEEDIVSWEVQAFENDDDDLTSNLGQQYFFVLSVELVSAEKMKTSKAAGGFVLFGSPKNTAGYKRSSDGMT